VQQVVDGLQAAEHAELLPEDAADVLAAQGADAVGRGRAGPEAFLEALLLLGAQRASAAAARAVEQAVGAGGVVAADPRADLAGGEQDLGAALLGGLPQQGQADGGQPAGDLGARLSADAGGQLPGAVVRLDVHGWSPSGHGQDRRPTRYLEAISWDAYQSLIFLGGGTSQR
jgi:hypothetical protein